METVLGVYNQEIMPRFRSGRYRLSLDRSVDPKCLYHGELPSEDAQVLSVHDRHTGVCAGSITFEPCMMLKDSIEIFSFTHPDRRRRGLNLFLRMMAILVIRTLYPETRWLVSFAEAEASVNASERLGFTRYPNMALDIFILELTTPNLNRIGSMLIPYITRYKNKSPS